MRSVSQLAVADEHSGDRIEMRVLPQARETGLAEGLLIDSSGNMAEACSISAVQGLSPQARRPTVNLAISWKRPMTCRSQFLSAAAILVATPLASPIISQAEAQIAPPVSADVTIDAAERRRIIDAVAVDLQSKYVFPKTAKAMIDHLRRRFATKAYEGLTSARSFADAVTADLRSVSQDRHLALLLEPQAGGGPLTSSGPVGLPLDFLRDRNFGLARVELLSGNVGYIDLQMFAPPELVGGRLAAAMALVADTNALIIDLRNNHGGDPKTVALLVSYFQTVPVLLNSFNDRRTGIISQSWSLGYVEGHRYTNPVYLLTGPTTFSGGEEFGYDMKQLKLATLVGERTGGGAHVVVGTRLDVLFVMRTPFGQGINAVTKTNWEGVGVEPDVPAPAAAALNRAHMLALDHIAAIAPPASQLLRDIEEARAKLRGPGSD